MEIVVVGAGSLGSLIGGLLAREHTVTLVGREAHVQAIRDTGLHVEGTDPRIVHPAASTTVPAAADLAIVTVKAYDTPAAADALADAQLDQCLSLQNGMGNEETLATYLSCPVLAGTCTYGARLAGPGRVEWTGIGEIVLGEPAGGQSMDAAVVGAALADAGLDTTVATDMPRRQWEKLAVNAGINAPTALARVENGALEAGPANGVAVAAAREVARVASEADVDLAAADAVTALEDVLTTTAVNTSSMCQDVEAGKRTEIDAINGYVVEHAVEPVPVNATLTRLVRTWEIERGLRPGG